MSFVFAEQHILILRIMPGIEPHIRNAVPDDILHSQFMHRFHMDFHIFDLGFRNFPISAERIAAVAVIGLPAIINDAYAEAQLFCPCAFRLDIPVCYVLMIGIPERIYGIFGRIRHMKRCHSQIIFPPCRDIFQSLRERNITIVHAYGQCGLITICELLQRQSDHGFQLPALFHNACFQQHQLGTFT